LSSGVNLATLLHVLCGENVKVNQNPKFKIHRIENVNICLKFLESKGVKLVNISSEGINYYNYISSIIFLPTNSEIVGQNIKIILGTIWILIRKFSIEVVEEGITFSLFISK
jgi:hypothetical protein